MTTEQTNPLTHHFADYLTNALRHLVEGGAEDLAIYIERMSRLSVHAAQTNDPKLMQELIAQAQLLGELNRIRAVNVGWHVIGDVITSGVALLASSLTHGLLPARAQAEAEHSEVSG